jgi:antitoxin CptB
VSEPADVRLRRLRMRSSRRGTREMDLILGGYAAGAIERLPPAMLDAFEAILSENDHDLYLWVSGQSNVPEPHQEIVARIRAHLAREGAPSP